MPGPLSVHQTLPHGLPKNHSRIPIRPATTAKINTSPVVRFTTLPYPAPSNIRPFLFSIIHRQDDCKAARQQNSEKSRPDENSLFQAYALFRMPPFPFNKTTTPAGAALLLRAHINCCKRILRSKNGDDAPGSLANSRTASNPQTSFCSYSD